MKRKLFAIGLAAVLLLAGCGGGGAAGNAPAASAPASSAPSGDWDGGSYWDMGMGENDASPAPGSTENSVQDSEVYRNSGAKLIRRAELTIQTEQFDQSDQALKQLVASCGGYLEQASVYSGGSRDANANRSGEYIIRVPADKFNQFFSGAGGLGYVTNKSETSDDVGEHYYDTEVRLKTQRAKQERLLSLLEKAETMEDIIALENALSEAEYQIEQYSSTLNRYDALISFSTFSISLLEVSRVTQEVGEAASLGERMADGFQTSFLGLVQGGRSLLIWFSYNLFLVVILAVAAAAAVIVGSRELKKLKQKEARSEDKEEG